MTIGTVFSWLVSYENTIFSFLFCWYADFPQLILPGSAKGIQR